MEVTQIELAAAVQGAKDILNHVQAGSKTLAKQRHRLVARILLHQYEALCQVEEYLAAHGDIAVFDNDWKDALHRMVGWQLSIAEHFKGLAEASTPAELLADLLIKHMDDAGLSEEEREANLSRMEAAAPTPEVEYRAAWDWLSPFIEEMPSSHIAPKDSLFTIQSELEVIKKRYRGRLRNISIESRTKAGEWGRLKETETK